MASTKKRSLKVKYVAVIVTKFVGLDCPIKVSYPFDTRNEADEAGEQMVMRLSRSPRIQFGGKPCSDYRIFVVPQHKA